jgi:hypothetical protein
MWATYRKLADFSPIVSPTWVHILLLLTVYFLISCWSLSLPGLEYDEVLFANAALGHLDESFIAYELKLGTLRLPLMLMNYIGALSLDAGLGTANSSLGEFYATDTRVPVSPGKVFRARISQQQTALVPHVLPEVVPQVRQSGHGSFDGLGLFNRVLSFFIFRHTQRTSHSSVSSDLG